MLNAKFLFFLFVGVSLYSCGPELDAKEVCRCFREVYPLPDGEADEKMKECMIMLDKYTKKHKANGSYETFSAEFDKCR